MSTTVSDELVFHFSIAPDPDQDSEAVEEAVQVLGIANVLWGAWESRRKRPHPFQLCAHSSSGNFRPRHLLSALRKELH